jgi:hypothetical protein
MKLKINSPNDIIFEWIPYYWFDNMKNINSNYAIAKWEAGPLYWNKNIYKRGKDKMNIMVNLKRLCNSQNITYEFLNNEVRNFFINLILNTFFNNITFLF